MKEVNDMDPDQFAAVQPLLDKIAEVIDQQLASEELRAVVGELGSVLGQRQIASLTIGIEVFDEHRECSLPLLSTGLSAFPGKGASRTWGDSSPQRYVVEEAIQVVPHDRCPRCWQVWDFKMQNPTCPHCSTTMGETCKLLIDSDECPSCNEGKVTVTRPRCDKCGYMVDGKQVVWG